MKNVGVIRNVDQLGRIVIPVEIRNTMNFDRFQTLEILLDDDSIILKKYKPGCHCCNEVEIKATVLGLNLCEKCINKFNEVREKIDELR